MAKKLTSAEWAAFANYVQQADHHEIYKLHMAQTRQTRKMFKGNTDMMARIDAIESKIKQTYKEACAKEML